MFENLIQKIVTTLEANTLIQEVFDYEVPQFQGDPVAVVSPSANEGDYETNVENLRIYAFTIRVFVKRTTPRTEKEADRITRQIASSIIDDFDKDYTFTGMTVPAGYTYIATMAIPSAWGYSGREDEFRVCEIDVRCKVLVDLNTIS